MHSSLKYFCSCRDTKCVIDIDVLALRTCARWWDNYFWTFMDNYFWSYIRSIESLELGFVNRKTQSDRAKFHHARVLLETNQTCSLNCTCDILAQELIELKAD